MNQIGRVGKPVALVEYIGAEVTSECNLPFPPETGERQVHMEINHSLGHNSSVAKVLIAASSLSHPVCIV